MTEVCVCFISNALCTEDNQSAECIIISMILGPILNAG